MAGESNLGFPALFYCDWAGTTTSIALGPFWANITTGRLNTPLFYLLCPLPTGHEIRAIAGVGGAAASVSLSLTVKHYTPVTDSDTYAVKATSFPWQGLHGGNRVSVTTTELSPSPPPGGDSAPPSYPFATGNPPTSSYPPPQSVFLEAHHQPTALPQPVVVSSLH